MPDNNISDLGTNDNFSNALNNILSNPEMLSMISSMAKQLKSDAESDEGAISESAKTPAPDQAQDAKEPSVAAALSALTPILSGNGAKLSKRDNDRACLLRALKPYLSHDRQMAVDYIIKLSRLGDILKTL